MYTCQWKLSYEDTIGTLLSCMLACVHTEGFIWRERETVPGGLGGGGGGGGVRHTVPGGLGGGGLGHALLLGCMLVVCGLIQREHCSWGGGGGGGVWGMPCSSESASSGFWVPK